MDKSTSYFIVMLFLAILNFILRITMVYYYYYWFLYKTFQIDITLSSICSVLLLLDLFYGGDTKSSENEGDVIVKSIAKFLILAGIFLVFYIIYLI